MRFDQGPAYNAAGVELLGPRRWDVSTVSPMLEYQWKPLESFAVQAGVRTDAHSYLSWLTSTRLTLNWKPSPEHTSRLILGDGVRRANDSDLQFEHAPRANTAGHNTTIRPATERMQSVEWRQEYHPDKVWMAGVSLYYQIFEPISFNAAPDIERSYPVGQFKMGGVEFELNWTGEADRVRLSHAIQQLFSSELYPDPTGTLPIQGVSAQPYGFGDDLANWAPHISKLI